MPADGMLVSLALLPRLRITNCTSDYLAVRVAQIFWLFFAIFRKPHNNGTCRPFSAVQNEKDRNLLMGGFHLHHMERQESDRIVRTLKDLGIKAEATDKRKAENR
jgi:hypothetical protein